MLSTSFAVSALYETNEFAPSEASIGTLFLISKKAQGKSHARFVSKVVTQSILSVVRDGPQWALLCRSLEF